MEVFQRGFKTYSATQSVKAFIESLSEDQAVLGRSAVQNALEAYGDKIPPELQPVVEHVMNATEEPIAARLMGAAMHPETRKKMAEVFDKKFLKISKDDVKEWIRSNGGLTVMCPKCSEVVLIGQPTEQANLESE